MKTQQLIWLILAFLLVACSPSAADTVDQPIAATISVSGTGTASVLPDVVDIQLGVDTVHTNPVEAVGQNTTQMNAVMAHLNEMQIAETDIQTTYYSMWVEDVYDQDFQPTGEKRYHVTNQINIRLRNLTEIGSLIEKATDAGATTIVGITFGVADSTELEQAALDNAIANAREKAGQIATEMDAQIGAIITVAEGGIYTPPVPYYGEKVGLGGGGGAVPISQGQFSMTASVQVVYELIP